MRGCKLKRSVVLISLVLISLMLMSSVSATAIDPLVLDELEDNGEVSVIVVLKDTPDLEREQQGTLSTKSLRSNSDKPFGLRKQLIKENQEEVLNKLTLKDKNNLVTNLKEIDVKSQVRQAVNGSKPNSTLLGTISETPEEESYDFRLNNQFTLVNGFSGNLTLSGLEKLIDSGLVERVGPNNQLEILMADSNSLINATSAWNVSVGGVNLTGLGETVCVLDTGIDYNHSALGGGWGNKVIAGYDFHNDDADPYDDNGHGTHVAGTIASDNGTYSGVSPGSKLIALKVCGSAGTDCYTSNIVDALDWCVSNASLYNISVISMSVGGGSYSGYCDELAENDFDLMTPLVNLAVENNISVVFASGNNGFNGSISGPACLSNATPVGATDKVDVITTYSNRCSILDLLAPGGTAYDCTNGVCSTCLGGGFCGKPGTSMATPHVSGAIALMKQYYKLAYNQTLTPSQAEHKLDITGKQIYDSASSNYYSRINILAALQPYITFDSSSTANESTHIQTNHSILINISSDVPLSNATLELDNNQGTVTNYSMSQINTTAYYCTFTNLSDGSFTYRIIANDTAGTVGYSDFRTFNINSSLTVTFNTPSSGSAINSDFNLNINITSAYNIINSTYNLTDSNGTQLQYNSTTSINSTEFSWADYVNITELNFTEGTYTLTAFANDGGNFTSTTSIDFYYDLSSPNITVATPSNNSYRKDEFNLSAMISDVLISNSYYNVTNSTGSLIQSNSNNSINSTSFQWVDLVNVSNSTFTDGIYNLTVGAMDSLNNFNQTVVTFNVDKTLPSISIINQTNNETIYYNNNSVFFRVNVTELNINDSTVYLSINKSGSWENYSMTNGSNATLTNTLFNFTLTGASNFTIGSPMFYKFIAVDLAGNSNQTNTFNFTVTNRDITSVNITAPVNNSVVEVGVRTLFNSSVVDPDQENLTYYWTISDHVNSTYSNSSFYHSFNTSGTYVVNLTVSDAQGSTLKSNISVTTNDTTLPVFTDLDYDSSVCYDTESQNITATAYDASGIGNITVFDHNNTLISVNSCTINGTNWTCNWLQNYTSAGTFNFTINVTDNSPNLNSNQTNYNFTVRSCSGSSSGSGSSSSSSSTSGSSGGGGGGSSTSLGTTSSSDDSDAVVEGSEEDSSSDADSGGSSDAEDSISDSSSSSSSGENSAPRYTEIGETTSVQSIALVEDESVPVTIGDGRVAITAVEIISKSDNNVTLTIQSFLTAPGGVSELSNSYQYFSADLGDLDSSEIDEIEINFEVKKSWLTTNSYVDSDVSLMIYSGGAWKELTTKVTSRGTNKVSFKATTDKLGYLAIAVNPSSNLITAAFSFIGGVDLFGLSGKQIFLIILVVSSVVLGGLYFVVRPKSEDF